MTIDKVSDIVDEFLNIADSIEEFQTKGCDRDY